MTYFWQSFALALVPVITMAWSMRTLIQAIGASRGKFDSFKLNSNQLVPLVTVYMVVATFGINAVLKVVF